MSAPASFWLDGRRCMVAADHPAASQAGAEILAAGGNAVDAAVATSMALAVVRPQSCGLGGGGFMLIHRPGGPSVAVDFRESAPAGALRARYLDPAGKPIKNMTVHGAWAVAVPGQVRGLLHVFERYGSGAISREQAIAPAVSLARRPLVVDKHLRRAMTELEADTRKNSAYPSQFAELYRRFTRGAVAMELGDAVDRSDLAGTLEAIARHGDAGFYSGPIADAIVSEVQHRGGPLAHDDLAQYQVREFEPLAGQFGEFDVLCMPPPSSGGAVIAQVMNVLALARRHPWTLEDPGSAHLLVEACKHAFADRARCLGDVAADVQRDVVQMIAVDRAHDILGRIDPDRTLAPETYGMHALRDDGGTSHFCVVDAGGMAVSATDTVNLTFGSYLHVAGTGIVLNNEIDDFAINPQTPNAFGLMESPRNLLQPGRRPLSSMAPTIVLRDGRVEMVAGASGGPRIITSTLEVILNVIAGGMSAQDAVTAPRLHHQWMPDEVWLSRQMSPKTVEGLRDRGHSVAWYPGTPGHAQIIVRTPEGWRGACDPDKGGAPAGA